MKEWPEYDPNDRWLPEPEEQVEEGPYLARFSTWSEVPREIRYEVERPTLIVLGECGLNERNRNGRYNTWCIPCNNAAGTAWTLNKWVSVGDKPSDQIQILDTEDDNGHAVAIEFGKNGRKITDDGTPVLIVQYPDRPTKVVRGWTRGYGTRDGQWFMLGLLGIRLENPMSWPGYAAQAGMYSPLGLACWAHLDGCRGDAYSVGRVDLRSLIEFLYGSQGRREIAPGVFLTCPVDARIEFDRAATHPRLHFPNGGPAFEFKKWPFKLKRSITSVDCDWDLGRVAIFVEGIDYPLVIQVDQGRPVDYAPQFSRN